MPEITLRHAFQGAARSAVLATTLVLAGGCGEAAPTETPDPPGPLDPIQGYLAPQRVPGVSVEELSAGLGRTCAIVDGQEPAVCWLGDLSAVSLTSPAELVSVRTSGPVVCGVGADGRIHCATDWLHDLALLSPHPFAAVAVGVGHGCALDMDGAAHCWGENGSGQLGHDEPDGSAPLPVEGDLRFSALTVGRYHSCGLALDGMAWCWGDPRALGSEGSEADIGPRMVAGGRTYVAITAGDEHTCALEASGDAYCWGLAEHGRTGSGTEALFQPLPGLVVGGHSFTAISAGGSHTCALTDAGEVFCWGRNHAGQLGAEAQCSHDYGTFGTGTFHCSQSPVRLAATLSFVQVEAGGAHTCGRQPGGAVYCWGGISP